MAEPDNTEQVDILPVLLLGLLVIYLFYLLRPPVLMFWHYGLGMGTSSEGRVAQTPQPPGMSTRAVPPPPTKVPVLPPLLQRPVATWRQAPPADAEMEALGQELEGLTNQRRQTVGRQTLPVDLDLRDIAMLHSWDMLDRNYLHPNSPDDVSPVQRVGKYHRRLFGLIRENVAKFDSASVQGPQVADRFMEQWMNHPRDRHNILMADNNRMATGCFRKQDPLTSQDQRRCTQLFAQVFAVAEQDIPETVTAGQVLSVRIHALEGFDMPIQLTQLNLQNGVESSSASLTPSGDVVMGQLTLNGPSGVYTLQLHVPDQHHVGRRLIVPGPYITVK